jgi:ABC-type Na+ transport system ATPase subunit NatA
MIDPRSIEVIDDETVAVYRHMTGAQRVRAVGRLYAMARMLIQSRVRAEHPDWTQDQLNRETVRRLSHGAS